VYHYELIVFQKKELDKKPSFFQKRGVIKYLSGILDKNETQPMLSNPMARLNENS